MDALGRRDCAPGRGGCQRVYNTRTQVRRGWLTSYLRPAIIALLALAALSALLTVSPAPLAANHGKLSLTPAPDQPLATVGLRHPFPDHPGPGDQGQLASQAPACDKDVDLTSTFAGVTPIAAQDNLICTSADIDTYVGQDGKTYVVQAGAQDAAWVHTDVSNPSSPVLVAVWEWTGPRGANTSTPDVKAFSQGNRDYIALSLERQAQLAFCGVVIMDVTDPLIPTLVEQFIGADWCDVHNIFVEKDGSGNGAFIYVTADNTQDLRVLDISSLPAITELGKYRRTARGFGATVFDDIYVHDVTVVAGKVYASYWRAGLDIFDASLIKVPGATVDETNPGVVNITPPLFAGTPFLVHHTFPSEDGSRVFIEDEITFAVGFEPVQMWTTASTPAYVDGIELGGSGPADVPFVLPAHNVEVRSDLDLDGDGSPDKRLYVGWYKAGLQAFDFDSSGFTTRRIYHQVQTEPTDDPFDGAWGVRLATIGTDTYVFQSDRRFGLIINRVDICSAVANPGQPDVDSDGVINACDNCPAWPNPGQSLPPWPIAADDPDCDGWSTADEGFISTNPNDNCGGNLTWPPNVFNAPPSTNIVDIFDIAALAPPVFFSTPGPGSPYSVRLDLTASSAPGDPIIDIFDVAKMAPPMFFSTCTP